MDLQTKALHFLELQRNKLEQHNTEFVLSWLSNAFRVPVQEVQRRIAMLADGNEIN